MLSRAARVQSDNRMGYQIRIIILSLGGAKCPGSMLLADTPTIRRFIDPRRVALPGEGILSSVPLAVYAFPLRRSQQLSTLHLAPCNLTLLHLVVNPIHEIKRYICGRSPLRSLVGQRFRDSQMFVRRHLQMV